MRRWTTRELRYLEEHAGDGAESVARALDRSKPSVEWQAKECGLSLRKRAQCPRCGRQTFKPLNKLSGWCAECTKELRMRDLKAQADAMREEAIRRERNDRERQRLYSAKNRAKKRKTNHGKSHG